MGVMMALLGEEGRGYELARRLESCGVWRTWLGDPTYATFSPFLSSPSAWDSFMAPDPSKSRAHLFLQMRVRALLFDKASASLFSSSSSSLSLHSLNPACQSPILPSFHPSTFDFLSFFLFLFVEILIVFIVSF